MLEIIFSLKLLHLTAVISHLRDERTRGKLTVIMCDDRFCHFRKRVRKESRYEVIKRIEIQSKMGRYRVREKAEEG